MANSTTHLDTISSAQSQKEVTANELFDAGSPAMTLGRRADTTSGLTWGYFGGTVTLDDGSLLQIANGTKTLTNTATNYLELDTSDGSVDVNAVGWTAGKTRLYAIVAVSGAVSGYTDWRTASVSIGAVVGVSSVAGRTGDVVITSADLADLGEAIDDRVAVLLVAAGLTLTYNDAGDLLTIALPAQPFDASAFYPGAPSASAKVLRVPIARAVTFAANFAGSYAKAGTAATASTAFDVQKNGVSVGTITFAIGATSATFVSSGGAAVNFAAGDVLGIVAPVTPDATLADIGFVLAGTR